MRAHSPENREPLTIEEAIRNYTASIEGQRRFDDLIETDALELGRLYLETGDYTSADPDFRSGAHDWPDCVDTEDSETFSPAYLAGRYWATMGDADTVQAALEEGKWAV